MKAALDMVQGVMLDAVQHRWGPSWIGLGSAMDRTWMGLGRVPGWPENRWLSRDENQTRVAGQWSWSRWKLVIVVGFGQATKYNSLSYYLIFCMAQFKRMTLVILHVWLGLIMLMLGMIMICMQQTSICFNLFQMSSQCYFTISGKIHQWRKIQCRLHSSIGWRRCKEQNSVSWFAKQEFIKFISYVFKYLTVHQETSLFSMNYCRFYQQSCSWHKNCFIGFVFCIQSEWCNFCWFGCNQMCDCFGLGSFILWNWWCSAICIATIDSISYFWPHVNMVLASYGQLLSLMEKARKPGKLWTEMKLWQNNYCQWLILWWLFINQVLWMKNNSSILII